MKKKSEVPSKAFKAEAIFEINKLYKQKLTNLQLKLKNFKEACRDARKHNASAVLVVAANTTCYEVDELLESVNDELKQFTILFPQLLSNPAVDIFLLLEYYKEEFEDIKRQLLRTAIFYISKTS